MITWVGDKLYDNQKYRLFKEYNILNPWRALEDYRRVDHRIRKEPSEVKIDTEAGPSKKRRRRRKCKEPAVEVFVARPFNPQTPLQILEPIEGVTVANLPTAHAIFRGRGEIIHVFDEKAKKPQVADQEVEELFEEDASLRLRRVRRRTPTPPYDLNITPSPPQNPEMVRLSMILLLSQRDDDNQTPQIL